MAQFMVQFFPDCVICVHSLCLRPQIQIHFFKDNKLRARAILLVFEKIYSCLFIQIALKIIWLPILIIAGVPGEKP